MGAILAFYSCTTKVDLVAEGEEKSVVFGFIDPTVDTQFVKITKTFATEGNAYDSALDPSLSEYSNLEAYILKMDGDDTVATYLLQEKTVTDKDSGVFYYPVQTVYYTDEINFSGNSDPNYGYTYQLQFTALGVDVKSEVPVVGPFETNNTQAIGTISFVNVFNPAGSNYANYLMIVNLITNVKRYEFTLRYNYTEFYNDGSFKEKFMDFKYPPYIAANTSGSSTYQFFIDGEQFYSSIGARLGAQDNEDNVSKRVIGKLDYIFDYAGDEYNTYIELSRPSSTINSEQNPYSNVDNGVGVWGSRGQTVFIDKRLLLPSIDEMVFGQYTIDYKFCSDDIAYQGQSIYCD
jgi:hypothetical protein